LVLCYSKVCAWQLFHDCTASWRGWAWCPGPEVFKRFQKYLELIIWEVLKFNKQSRRIQVLIFHDFWIAWVWGFVVTCQLLQRWGPRFDVTVIGWGSGAQPEDQPTGRPMEWGGLLSDELLISMDWFKGKFTGKPHI
jgi:hypothetical protein